jgi:acid stress chaperone HdeB
MRRLQLAVPTMMLALSPWSIASAQVTVDVAKITCDQFTLYKITDPQNIAIWLSGYYHGKHDNTLVDTQQLSANLRKITNYCYLKPQETVMQAVESVFGPPK